MKYISLYPNDTPARSWEDLIPNFDESKLEKRELPLEEKASVSEETIKPDTDWTDFESDNDGGWQIANRATKAQIFEDASKAAAGNKFLLVRYNNSGREGGGYAEKGILKTFETPTDISQMQKFVFAVQTNALANVTVQYNVKVRFYSGDHILESTAQIQPDKYQTVSVDIQNSKWQYFDKVDKIKIWYSVENNTTQGGTIYFDDIGFVSGKKVEKGCFGGIESTLVLGLFSLALAGSVALKKRREK